MLIACSELLDVAGKLIFAQWRRELEWGIQSNVRRDDLRDELLDRADTYGVEHSLQGVGVACADVAVNKFVKHIVISFKFLQLPQIYEKKR